MSEEPPKALKPELRFALRRLRCRDGNMVLMEHLSQLVCPARGFRQLREETIFRRVH